MNNHTEVVGIFSTPIYFSICDEDITDSIKFLESTNLKSRIDVKNKSTYGSISEDTYMLLFRDRMAEVSEIRMRVKDN